MTKEKQLEILIKDGCSRKEAEKYLKQNRVTIFSEEDFETNFDQYMKDWFIDDDEIQTYRNMIENKVPVSDWGIVEDEEGIYYIIYEN